MSPVKNQGGCGSCWAFSGVGAIEASLLMNNQSASLSEQFYVDCAPNPDNCGGTGGCSGSTQPQLFAFAQTDGAMSEDDYTYTAATGTCQEASYTSGKAAPYRSGQVSNESQGSYRAETSTA